MVTVGAFKMDLVSIWGHLLQGVDSFGPFYVGRENYDRWWSSGETVERFNSIERFTHWLTASSFIILALTGLIYSMGAIFNAHIRS